MKTFATGFGFLILLIFLYLRLRTRIPYELTFQFSYSYCIIVIFLIIIYGLALKNIFFPVSLNNWFSKNIEKLIKKIYYSLHLVFCIFYNKFIKIS